MQDKADKEIPLTSKSCVLCAKGNLHVSKEGRFEKSVSLQTFEILMIFQMIRYEKNSKSYKYPNIYLKTKYKNA